MSLAGAAAVQEIAANDNYRWYVYPFYGFKANYAIIHAAYSDPQLNRRIAAIGGGERRILTAIWPEESTMMTNVHMAHGAPQLNFFPQTTILITFRSSNLTSLPPQIVECLIILRR